MAEQRSPHDRMAQFLIMVGEVCESARVAGLPITVWLTDGSSVSGIPGPAALLPAGESGVDDTGMRQHVEIGDGAFDLEAVVAVSVDAPGNAGLSAP